MRARAALILLATLLLAAACVSVTPGETEPVPTSGLTSAAPSQAADVTVAPIGPTEPPLQPVATPPPVPTVDPNATPDPSAGESFDVHALLNADVTVFNLSDFELSTQAAIHDPDTGENVPVADFTIAPNEIAERTVIGGNAAALPYRITFSYAGGSGAGDGECVVSVLTGDNFAFVAVNAGVTVNKNGAVPASLDETLIASSSLCAEPPPSSPRVTP